MEALEEKKGAVTGKISSAIDSLEKKRKEHVDMAKADPKNASQHKDKIAMIATKIDDLMSKLEKVERSKKAKEEKKDKETIKENEDKAATSTSGLAKVLRQLAQNLPATKGISPKEIEGIEKLINTILSKASAGEIALAIGKAQLALDNSTKNLGGKPAMPAVPKKSGNFSLNNDR
jgi:membrane-associated HD superfamily phosphohydrolase